MNHARLSASSSERWINCPGSVRLSEGLPDIESEYAREGTEAHALAASELTGKTIPDFDPPAEMIEGVKLFVDTVNAAPGVLSVERQFDLALLSPPEDMFGTADAVKIDGRTLRVFDFKYGQGVVVEVAGNTQLMYYALGAVLAEIELNNVPRVQGFQDPLAFALDLFDEIIVTIVQPRATHPDGPVRAISMEPWVLADFAAALMGHARMTQRSTAVLSAGTWCRFCPAQGQCPALAKHAQLVAQMDFDAVPMDTPPAPELLTNDVIADLLTKAQVLNNWFTALRAHLIRELSAGREVPGWKLVLKRPRRVWNDPQEVDEWATKQGLDVLADLYKTEMKSPAQVEKLVGKKNLPKDLYASVSSGLTLAPSSDPRPAQAIGPAEDFAALLPASPDDIEGDNGRNTQ